MSNSLPLKTYAQVIPLLLLPYVVQEQLPLILLEQRQKNFRKSLCRVFPGSSADTDLYELIVQLK